MKHNYKFKIGEKELPPEQIDKHKDFNRVLHHYRNLTAPYYRKPLYKNPKAFAGLVMILSSAALVYLTTQEETKTKPVAETLNPVVQQVDTQAKSSFEAIVVPYNGTDQQTKVYSIGELGKLTIDGPGTKPGYRLLSSGDLSDAHYPLPPVSDPVILDIGTPTVSTDTFNVVWKAEFPSDAAKDQSIFWFNTQTGAWEPVMETVKWLQPKAGKATGSQNEEDGFTVVEYDPASGEMKPVKDHSTDGKKSDKLIRTITIRKAGMYAAGKNMAQ